VQEVKTTIVGGDRLWSSAVGHALDREPGVTVTGWGLTAEAARLIARHAPAVLVVGTLRITGPFSSALRETVQAAAASRGDCRVVVSSLSVEPSSVRAAFAAGVFGYVAADDDVASLADAVRQASAGGSYASPAAASAIAREARAGAALSTRESHVVEGIAHGWSSKEIADALHVTVRTVETSRSAIARKLGVHDRREVVAWALRRGLLS
jgi:DNA-binding NarL/FixJ family response regulator